MKRLIVLLVLISFAGQALAQQNASFRSGKMESSFVLRYQEDMSIKYQGGSGVDVGSDYGWGFRFGYNYTPKFNVGFQFDWMSAPYSAYLAPADDETEPQTIRHKMDQWGGTVKGIYHFSENRFTPYIEGGLGWATIDSNIASSPPVGGCWWHPWWGYVCDTWQSSYTDTSFSYELGAGLRLELNNRTFIRASVSRKWIDSDFASSQPEFYYAQIEIGAMVWN
ncbi:Outer membrane protein W [Alteromonadaceae bacterium Bs31]|nr:Outer membrane protein W [Alteromonadaceae bacterium Bs31]